MGNTPLFRQVWKINARDLLSDLLHAFSILLPSLSGPVDFLTSRDFRISSIFSGVHLIVASDLGNLCWVPFHYH